MEGKFEPKLKSIDSWGNITWEVEPGKTESWTFPGWRWEEIERLNRKRPKSAYNLSKKIQHLK